MGRLAGKVALITGTAGGQGAAAARLFAREGATVVGCDLDEPRARAVAEEVLAAGGAMTADAPVDLAEPDAAAAWVNRAAERAGGIDILYNNASTPWVGPFEEMTFENWRFTHREWVLAHSRRLATAVGKGVYLGDTDFTRRPDRFLSDANFRRLEEIRARRDPDGLFCSYQIAEGATLNGDHVGRLDAEI